MFRQTKKVAKLLPSFVGQKSAAAFRTDVQRGKSETTSDYIFNRDFSSSSLQQTDKTITKDITVEPISGNTTSDVKESTSLHTDTHGSSRDQCLVESHEESLSAADAVMKKGPPEIPLYCCNSGCPNCVWIEFMAEMTEAFSDGGDRAQKLIEEIEDPSMKAFLLLELDRVKKLS